jgi:hypothetical protein
MITVNQSEEILLQIIDAFEGAGGSGKPRLLQVHLSWAETETDALAQVYEQWRSSALSGPVAQDIRLAEHFDVASQFVSPEELRRGVDISPDLSWHADNLARYEELGFDTLFLHNVGTNQEAFIDAFGEKVLPQLSVAGV